MKNHVLVILFFIPNLIFSQYFYNGSDKVFFKKNEETTVIKVYEKNSQLLDQVSLKRLLLGFDSVIVSEKYVEIRNRSKLSTILSHLDNYQIEKLTPIVLNNDSEVILKNNIGVKLKSGYDETDLQEALGKYVVKDLKQSCARKGAYSFRLLEGNAVSVSSKLYETGIFVYSSPYMIVKGETDSFDPSLDNQFYLHSHSGNYGSINADIDANLAWDISDGSGVKVAVFDAGVELTHDDLENNLLPGFTTTSGSFVSGGENLSGNGHGTKVAGVIAAEKNSIGTRGVAYGASIIPVKIFDSSNNMDHEGLEAIIDYLNVNGVEIISMSARYYYNHALVADAISDFTTNGRNGKGGIFVCSARNTTNEIALPPCILNNTITVGAIGEYNQWVNSGYGSHLDLVCYGRNIYSTQIGNGYAYDGGTSYATPMVSGICALVLSLNPQLNREDVTNILFQTCKKESPSTPFGTYSYGEDLGHPGGTWNKRFGHGVANAYNAVLATDCSSPYIISNEIITKTRVFTGCNLNINSTTVESTGSVEIKYAETIVLDTGFELEEGGVLEIKEL